MNQTVNQPKFQPQKQAINQPISHPINQAKHISMNSILRTDARQQISQFAGGQHSTGSAASGSSTVMALKGRILQELESNPSYLLALNPSRREAIAQYLDRLQGQSLGPSFSAGQADAAAGLRRWIECPRSPAQELALQIYFEEVALIFLGQVLLLKAWSDRGIRHWSISDLGRVNWVLAMALKPYIPIDRESWQVLRSNIYSWYNPGQEIQRAIWNQLDVLHLQNEAADFFTKTLRNAREGCPPIPQGYDTRFFRAIWEHAGSFGFEVTPHGPLKRQRTVFSPTLRDGTMVRTGPATVNWIGLEASSFQLMIAELAQLWLAPSTPPFWAIGSGLEVHSREQLAFGMNSPKPSLLSKIAEMESCDAAFVLEEQAIRGQTRNNIESLKFRELADSLPYFKKLRKQGTTLGDLQACVAITKLRPGGLLWWAREEPLSSDDGIDALNFLLERTKVICEWDFSSLSHSLSENFPLFSKHLFLLQRTTQIEERLNHRPIRINLEGQLRSHVEVPLLFQDAFKAFHGFQETSDFTGEDNGFSENIDETNHAPTRQFRGQWKAHVNQSPIPQKEWAERWPTPSCQNTLRILEQLRVSSIPLANIITVLPTPKDPHNFNHSFQATGSAFRQMGAIHSPDGQELAKPKQRCGYEADTPGVRGIWIEATFDGKQRSLLAKPFFSRGFEKKGNGFLLLVSDGSWISPLCRYLESDIVRHWIDQHAERKGERWVINEQVIKWIPVPKSLLGAMGSSAVSQTASSLPPAWTSMCEKLVRLSMQGELSQEPFSRSPSSPEETSQDSAPSTVTNQYRDLIARIKEGLSTLPKPVSEAAAPLLNDSSTENSTPEIIAKTEQAKAIRAALFVSTSQALEQLLARQDGFSSVVTESGRIKWSGIFDILPRSELTQITLHQRLRLSGSLPLHVAIGRVDRVKAPSPGILLSTEIGFSLHLGSDSQLVLDMLWDQLEGMVNSTWSELLQFIRLPRRLELAESTARDIMHSYAEISSRFMEITEILSQCSLF